MAIPTPYSYRQYTGDGVAKDFQVPFPYLERGHVHVYLNDTELTEGTDFVWTSDTEVRLTTAPQAAVTGTTPKAAEQLTVRRQTPEDDQIVQWKDGSYVIAADLNDSDLQWLYLIQEHHDWLVRRENNLGALPGGGGSTGPVSQYWNKLARHLDPGKDTANEKANVVDTEDQKTPDATGLKSGGWISDDDHIATTGALAERFDAYVQDTKPPDPPITEVRQPGKIWIDDGALQIAYWEPAAKAWIQLANTGPKGDKGDAATIAVGNVTSVPYTSGATVTNTGDANNAVFDFALPKGKVIRVASQSAPPTTIDGDPIRDGDLWFNTAKAQLYAWYDDGTSQQWVSISKTGPKGDTGPTGPQGPQGIQGVVGPVGPTGPKGADSSVPGPTGSTGPAGPQGPTGAASTVPGPKGDKGDPQRVFTSSAPPSGAVPTDLWFNTKNGQLYALYNDGNSTQWVSISKVGPKGADGLPQKVIMSQLAPPSPAVGDLWFNTDKAQLYAWYDDGSSTQWVSISRTGPQGDAGLQGATGPQGAKGDKGDTGAAGATGPVGVTGPQGPQGVKGDKGDTGSKGDPTRVITSSTPPGSAVPTDLWFNTTNGQLYAYYNDGNSTQWVSISKVGPKGADSTVPGPQGPQGVAGPQGLTGPKGDTGPQGVKGNTGAQGPQGVKGDQGIQGTPNTAVVSASPPPSPVPGDLWLNTINGQLYAWYNDGSSSQWISISKVGPKGDKGDKGDTGATGPQGVKGDQGIQGVTGAPAGFATPQITTLAAGSSATVSASGPDHNKQFTFGIPQGIKGDKGDKGEKGDPVTVGTGTVLPLTPDDGDLFYNTTTSKLQIYLTPGGWTNIN